MLYLVWMRWKSGSISYYAARGKDDVDALRAVMAIIDRFGGAADVVSGGAFDWPSDPPCPMRDPGGPAHAFKLRARSYVESVLYALGVLASDLPSPPSTPSRGEPPPPLTRPGRGRRHALT